MKYRKKNGEKTIKRYKGSQEKHLKCLVFNGQ